MGAQEPGKGVFSHQTKDSLLGLVECVSTWRVDYPQQSLTGFCIQIHLKRIKQVSLSFILSIHNTIFNLSAFCFCHHSTNLLWGVRVNKLAADAAGHGLLLVWRGDPVVFTGQPELKVLLAELWTQENTKRLQTTWYRETYKPKVENNVEKWEKFSFSYLFKCTTLWHRWDGSLLVET